MPDKMLKPGYIFVSEQPRHQLLFDQLSQLLNGDWHYINRRDDFNLALLNRVKPRYIFMPHWSYKIPAEITQQFTCVMFHMTDLPFGRGGSPLQNLIVGGFKETKLTAFCCVEALDAGPIYNQAPLSLAGTATDIFKAADELVVKLIIDIIHKDLQPKEQCGDVSLFQRRTPAQGNIEKLTQLSDVYDYIRMLDAQGYPNAFIESEHLKLSFANAQFKNGKLTAEVVFKEIKNVT